MLFYCRYVVASPSKLIAKPKISGRFAPWSILVIGKFLLFSSFVWKIQVTIRCVTVRGSVVVLCGLTVHSLLSSYLKRLFSLTLRFPRQYMQMKALVLNKLSGKTITSISIVLESRWTNCVMDFRTRKLPSSTRTFSFCLRRGFSKFLLHLKLFLGTRQKVH